MANDYKDSCKREALARKYAVKGDCHVAAILLKDANRLTKQRPRGAKKDA